MPRKSTLLLVHGMGKPTDETFAKWKETLKALYERYSDDEAFEDRFDCVNIEYDSIIEQRRDQWEDLIDAMAGIGGLGFLPSREDLESVIEDNFFTTHILDMLLYRFVEPVAQNMRAHVVQKISAAIQAAPNSSEISILAHSLGTSVVHDSVNAMYDTVSPTNFRFHLLGMIANVSRTLENRWEVYDPKVRPGIDGSATYVTDHFLTASHAWDPLVALRRFDPDDAWPDPATRDAGRASIVRPTIIRRWNVHDFAHYIEDPRVHVPMFRALRHSTFVTKAKEAQAILDHANEDVPERLDEFRKELKKLLHGEADFSWKRLFDVYKGVYQLIKDFTDEDGGAS